MADQEQAPESKGESLWQRLTRLGKTQDLGMGPEAPTPRKPILVDLAEKSQLPFQATIPKAPTPPKKVPPHSRGR